MKKKNAFPIFLLVIFLATSCGVRIPTTMGDPKNAKTYGYHPLDPLPVQLLFREDTTAEFSRAERLLFALPDETMRLAIGEITGEGGIHYGTAKAGYKGKSYIVILDYIKFNTKSFGVKLTETDSGNTNDKTAELTENPNDADVIIPVYIGIGARLTANITVNEGSVDLGNLFALGAAANAKKITGTMVIQTLGISGETISPIIPMPSEINPTTIQNAILALGTIKAKIYDGKTKITPRVVGVYNNLGGGAETINGFISALLVTQQELPIN